MNPERMEYIRNWAASNSQPSACQAMRELLEVIDEQRDELSSVFGEIEATIDILIPPECRVRVCEGGEPEDLCKSMAVSVSKLALQADADRVEIGMLRRELDRRDGREVLEGDGGPTGPCECL